MYAAEPGESCPFKTRYRSKDAGLFAMLQLCLEADNIVERSQSIVLSQLDHRMGSPTDMWVG